MVAIFVAFMFVSLVLMDLAIEKWQAWRVAHPSLSTSPRARVMEYRFDALCQVPEGIHLSNHHTWVKPDPTGGLEIGADTLIVRAVGAVRRIVLPKVGDQVTVGQPLFRLEHNGCAVNIPSALTGRVMAVNNRLADQPELLTSDPYGSGWVCHLTPTRVEETAPSVRFGEQAAMWLEEEFVRFSEFIFAHISPDFALGATSQDGGLPAVGYLRELGPTAWSAFEASFLRQP
ncbi:MAG: glycine cleavage system protein H [Terriglobia bacterium]|jgi:glycine cleavage system H protein